MAPVMPRLDSRARAHRAFELRGAHRTWKQIADELGYKTTTGARQAVERLLESTPPTSVEARRRTTAESLRQIGAALSDRLAEAVTRGDDQAAASLARELRAVTAELSKLWGLYAPERHDVAVSVTAEDTRARLLAVAAERDQLTARRPAAIEGEVIR